MASTQGEPCLGVRKPLIAPVGHRPMGKITYLSRWDYERLTQKTMALDTNPK